MTPASVENQPVVVVDPQKVVRTKQPKHIVVRMDFEAQDKKCDSFLILKSSTLNRFAGNIIQKSLKMPYLRVIFVYLDDGNADAFFDRVQELNCPKLLPFLFRVSPNQKEDMFRIIHAWSTKQQDRVIATAHIDDDELVVKSCSLKPYRIHFSAFPGLDELSKAERSEMRIDKFGHRVFWPNRNVSIDLDSIRYAVDDEFRRSTNLDALSEYKDFIGNAIRAVMANHGLTQEAVSNQGGPTDRHIRRIEKGDQELTAKMIDRLSKAHNLSSKEYIEELISACDEITEQEALAVAEAEE